MRLLVTIFCLLFATGLQAQSYTVTENNCRVYFSNALDREAFWVDQLLWRHVGSNPDQLQIFDGISAITVQDANLVNYPTTDSLIVQMEAWIVECDTAGQAPPGPPAPTPLFANGDALELDGTSEYVEVADANDLSMTEGGSDIAFTAAAWVYWETDQNGLIIGKATTTPTDREYFMALASGTDEIEVGLFDSNDDYIGRGSSPIGFNQWHHIAFTYDGSETSAGIDIYIDGILSDDRDINSGVYDGMTADIFPVSIGAYSDPTTYFSGKIDQVCLFRNVELTLPEIKELMTIRDVTQFTYYDSLVLYQEYDNDDATAGGITDLSSAGNNGSLQNGDATNFVQCVPWPYPYQLDTSATYSNLTSMQSSADTSFGGFGWDFDGAAEYFVIPDDNLLSFGNGTTDSPFSISLWVNMDDATKFRMFSKFKITSNDREYYLSTNASDFLTLSLYDESAAGARISRTSDNTLTSYEGQTIHIASTYDGSSTTGGIKLYINGIEITSTGSSSGSYTAMENLNHPPDIGRYQPNPDYANGIIHDVIVLNKELSAAEVLTMYNKHAPRDETTTALAGNLVGYWRGFNSTNVASGVLDQSGNGLNGTPNNMEDADFQYTTPREIYDASNAGSFDFDGSTEYISVADSDSLSMLTLDETSDTLFSISAWVNMDAWNYPIANKYTSSGNLREYFFTINSSGQLNGFIYDQSASASIQNTSTATAALDQWHHVAMTYNGNGLGTSIRLYLNGESVETTPASSGSYVAMENKSSTFNFALRNSTYGNGKTSNVTIMKGIRLQPCQVQEIYNDGSPVDPTSWTFWSNDFIHYKLNQTDSATTTEGISNISPNNSCNGTATNMDATNIITTSYPTN